MVTVNGARVDSVSFSVPVSAARLQSELINNILPSVGAKNIEGINGIKENDIEMVVEGWLLFGRYQQWLIQIYAHEVEPEICEVELVALGDKLFTVFLGWGAGKIITLGKSISKRNEIEQAIRSFWK